MSARSWCLAALLTALAAAPAAAQVVDEAPFDCCGGDPEHDHPPGEERAPEGEAEATPEAPPAGSEEEAAAEEDADGDGRWLAVHAGWVHTVTGPLLRDVTILARDGKIVAIGADVAVPAGAEELDARRFHVYPGLVAHDSSGLVGNPAEDSTDVYGLNLVLGLSAGITTVGASGQVVKLSYGTLEGHLVTRRQFVSLNWSTPEARRALRGQLEQVRKHLRAREAAAQAKARGEKPEEVKPLRGTLEQLAKLLSGELSAQVKADGARELSELAELAIQYGFEVEILGATEGWTVASLLGRARCSAVVVPRARRREDPRLERPNGWTIENAARLHQAGVPVTIMSANTGIGTWGLAGHDLFTLSLEAAYAMRGGLDAEAALASITLMPARLLGVDHRVGSIEVGKDCDLVIAPGDLLDYRVLPEWTVVNGRIAYDKDKETLLRHIRPRDLQGKNLEIPQLWPRDPGPEPAHPEGS